MCKGRSGHRPPSLRPLRFEATRAILSARPLVTVRPVQLRDIRIDSPTRCDISILHRTLQKLHALGDEKERRRAEIGNDA